ncbi:MAG: DUF4384 domain-containing protein [Cellvibrionaceae bacterium]|nr:DUF4384 domain-containing protein [Cellvibrionaceae bacterium]
MRRLLLLGLLGCLSACDPTAGATGDGPETFVVQAKTYRAIDQWQDQPGDLQLTVIPHNALSVAIGQTLSWQIHTAAPGYLWLYVVNEDGSFTRLFPNDYQTDNYQTRDTVLTLPQRQSWWRVCAEPPTGAIKVVFIFSQDKRESLPLILSAPTAAKHMGANQGDWVMRYFEYTITAANADPASGCADQDRV